MFKKLLTAILTFAMLLGSLPYEAVAYASESPGGGVLALWQMTHRMRNM